MVPRIAAYDLKAFISPSFRWWWWRRRCRWWRRRRRQQQRRRAAFCLYSWQIEGLKNCLGQGGGGLGNNTGTEKYKNGELAWHWGEGGVATTEGVKFHAQRGFWGGDNHKAFWAFCSWGIKTTTTTTIAAAAAPAQTNEQTGEMVHLKYAKRISKESTWRNNFR